MIYTPELGSYAMLELSALILEMCPESVFEDIVDVYPEKQPEKHLSFSTKKISKILGVDIGAGEIEDILKRYNFKYENKAGVFELVVPSMRLDLVIEEDMVEEVGRIMGYEKVEGKIPKINLPRLGNAGFKPKVNGTYEKIIFARNKLLNDGYSEVMNTTFSDKGEVSVLASASDKNFLRNNLSDGLKESVKLNQANAPLLGMNDVKIFEIGTVFKKSGEEMHVAYGDKKEVKEVTLDHFCKSASPDAFAQSLGPSLRSATPSQKHTGEAFKMWSLFPFIARDLAVWVPRTSQARMLQIL